MGSGQSMIGLRMIEVVYPAKGRQSIFKSNAKAQAALDKEVHKRGLHLDDLEPEDEPIDGDMDNDIERVVKKVFQVYDRKNQGSLPRKVVEHFFEDCLDIYAIRTNQKKKDLLGKVDKKKAMAASIAKMSTNASITAQEFEQFIFAYDMDEALEAFFGHQGLEIDPNVQLVDVSQFTNQNREGPKLVYRDYPDD